MIVSTDLPEGLVIDCWQDATGNHHVVGFRMDDFGKFGRVKQADFLAGVDVNNPEVAKLLNNIADHFAGDIAYSLQMAEPEDQWVKECA